MTDSIFTYAQACAQLEAVRRATQAADERLQQLRSQIGNLAKDSPEAGRLKAQINEAVQQWANDILALGALPKGLWTVDFDSGHGFYYCWTLNEPELTHYHAYEAGFAARKPLVDGVPPDFPDAKPPVLN
jgi:hypothetical protein